MWRESLSMTNDIIISGHLFRGGLCCFFKKVLPSVTIFIFTTQIHYWLPWLRKNTLKMHSPVTTLTTQIYIKNTFINDYAGNDDIRDNMKNSFITEFADYPFFNTRWEIWFSWLRWYIDYTDYADILTMLTTLIFHSTWKTISS